MGTEAIQKSPLGALFQVNSMMINCFIITTIGGRCLLAELMTIPAFTTLPPSPNATPKSSSCGGGGSLMCLEHVMAMDRDTTCSERAVVTGRRRVELRY
ncbi:hypothetical protein BT96DRAFT_128821 [Gymnopus androsaceus JB14]|uniref:Uncharacterized protein n=1 Tax=Gymnopus androsaceus JB14 TaxID=1447944 RepID=A0A6A4IE17_9AGAR|nr:hypothetical protein BT96DRAFT_128821 [Gymnopus androsaceus JB14]